MKDFFRNKHLFSTIVKTFTISTLIVFFAGIFFVGLFAGYIKGKTESQKEFTAYLNSMVATSPTTTPEPTRSRELTPTTKLERSYFANWGGPELWTEVNKKRGELGVNPLSSSDELCTIASIRLNELIELGTLDGHEGFSKLSEEREDLKWIFDKYGVVAEFLAMGGDTPTETVELWENTLGHKKLLTGGEYVWGCIYAQNTFAVAITAY